VLNCPLAPHRQGDGDGRRFSAPTNDQNSSISRSLMWRGIGASTFLNMIVIPGFSLKFRGTVAHVKTGDFRVNRSWPRGLDIDSIHY
jgi:hypothetical protein